MILSSRHARDKIGLRFVYAGEVLAEAGKGLLYVGARHWYPNRGLAMSDFDLTFHYPPEWMLVATGKPGRQYRRQWLRRCNVLRSRFPRRTFLRGTFLCRTWRVIKWALVLGTAPAGCRIRSGQDMFEPAPGGKCPR